MSTGYVAPTIDTHDAARTAQSLIDRAPLDAVIAVIQAQAVVLAVKFVAATVITKNSLQAEQDIQKAKRKV